MTEPGTRNSAVQAVVSDTFHREWGRVVATLIHRTGDWDLAEECAQEAFAQAARTWPRDGVPDRPGAWLMTVARNRAIDRLRRAAVEATKREEAAVLDDPHDQTSSGLNGDRGGVPDERLRLMFTCCHPALPPEARVALTLRTLAGLTTAEIARAFLMPEATMAKRLVRAKHKIRDAGIPYRVPPAHLLPERTHGVLTVVYLLFNEGYAASTGSDLVRVALCDEAIRLGRCLVELMPEESEAAGLLALMLFQHSRRDARADETGDLMTLEDQDRSRWDREEIAEATTILTGALAQGRVGSYQVQATIAECHATASTASSTDWRRVASLYGELARLAPSPVVELNRAVAVAMTEGPAAGLAILAVLEATDDLKDYHLLPATHADLLRRLGHLEEAAAQYREGLSLARTDADRRFLARRLYQVTDRRADTG